MKNMVPTRSNSFFVPMTDLIHQRVERLASQQSDEGIHRLVARIETLALEQFDEQFRNTVFGERAFHLRKGIRSPEERARLITEKDDEALVKLAKQMATNEANARLIADALISPSVFPAKTALDEALYSLDDKIGHLNLSVGA